MPNAERLWECNFLRDIHSEFGPASTAFQLWDLSHRWPQPPVNFLSQYKGKEHCLASSPDASFCDLHLFPPSRHLVKPSGCARDGCGWVWIGLCLFLTGHELSPQSPRQRPSFWRWVPSLISPAWEAPPRPRNSVSC